ncbi:G-protein coupled receptor [Metarhizium robertsii]|uniref:Glucose receptor Git3 n=2 Tax=Metarhizium robertsii TaxID=568076 RepID=E9EXQ1_METRA|nr:Glucose receptor Git3 [Metarhizium robertsii ARSEF 23]EFY99871.1 Glucose receptor Git3 [Metarhizium robertsii ARSEF 23]EXV06564.1 G-protein coupled receptor [Metarhizium robertsii]
MVSGRDVKHPVRHEGIAANAGSTIPSMEDTFPGNLTHEHLLELHVAAMVVGFTSLLATLVAVAFFIQMRRRFRHDLILLLILSDMLATFWLVLLPAIELARGRIPSNSTLCQISGFFLSVGIEACDLTVLLIAVHTALYIFRGRSGLYPYRFLAYALVATGSLMLTSLAFINNPGFVNSGAYCYFPARPTWTLRFLSWVPRYVVCAVMIFIYTCIYIYMRCIMIKVDEPNKRRKVDEPFFSRLQQLPRRGSVPPTPPIAYHGLIPPTPPIDNTQPDYGWNRGARYSQHGGSRKGSLVGNGGGQPLLKPPVSATSQTDCEERSLIVAKDPFKDYPPSVHCRNGSKDEATTLSPTDRPAPTQHIIGCSCMVCTGAGTPHIPPPLNIELRLQDGTGEAELPTNFVLSPTTLIETGLPNPRHKIRRQLRRKFIYPVFYILGWMVPFAAHVSQADRTGRPFPLVLAGLISLCIQGLVDSVVFLMLEKPWRHRKRPACFMPLRKCSTMKNSSARVGRTREEMLVEGRLAKTRRDREEEDQRRQPQRLETKKREWWDAKLPGIDESGDEDL